jgi:hypothetical protein
VTNVDRMTASGMTASAMMVGAWAEQNRCLVVILLLIQTVLRKETIVLWRTLSRNRTRVVRRIRCYRCWGSLRSIL